MNKIKILIIVKIQLIQVRIGENTHKFHILSVFLTRETS